MEEEIKKTLSRRVSCISCAVEEGEDEKEGSGWRHGLVLVECVEQGAAEQGGEYRSGDRGDLVSQEVLVGSVGTRAEGRPHNIVLFRNETYITRRCVSRINYSCLQPFFIFASMLDTGCMLKAKWFFKRCPIMHIFDISCGFLSPLWTGIHQ